MEAYDEDSESFTHKPPLSLEAKMEELVMTKEELKRAKDSAMQSWLDSRLTIDKLEKLQSHLASAKNSSSMSKIVVADLESELEATIASIESKKEAQVKAAEMIDETRLAVDRTREELETIRQNADEERRARLTLKQVLRHKKQTLRTLQLTLRALRMETEAYHASAEKAVHHINCAESDVSISWRLNQEEEEEQEHEEDLPVKALQQMIKNSNTVELSLEDYHALQRKAKEETSLAKWRVSVSLEQKLAAEESRNLALAKLKEIEIGKGSETIDGGEGEEEQEGISTEVEEAKPDRAIDFPKARIDPTVKSGGGPKRHFRGLNIRMAKKKNKPFILRQISSLILSIKRLFR